MSYEVYESDSIQSLFLKSAFIFKQINLDVYLSPTSSETVQLRMPKVLSSDNNQVGSIQYGGVKYPITPASKLNLKYVELRLNSTFLKEMNVFTLVHNLIEESDANGWLKYKFTTLDEIKLARSCCYHFQRDGEGIWCEIFNNWNGSEYFRIAESKV